MDDKKFCFIICTNSSLYYDECMEYIQRLRVPEGYQVEALGVTDAKSMAAGYNEGMAATDAKFKIYMHQDVFLIYTDFLQSVLDIFESDSQIGMIGVVGAEKMAPDGIMWHTWRIGNLYEQKFTDSDEYAGINQYRYSMEDGLWDVQAIDGLLMITSKDLNWREDLFDGWDFYDVSQSLEMLRAGFRVVVPEQRNPWCMHDDGILNLQHYNGYRKKCLDEYQEIFKN